MYTRRQVLQLGAVGTMAALSWTGEEIVIPQERPGAFAGCHSVKPLPFDPARLSGLSESMILSHHRNQYTDAVKRLNQIEDRLASIDYRSASPWVVGEIKREELMASNSVHLHECYFSSLGGDGKPTGPIRDALEASFGSFDRWKVEFIAIALSLVRGGWALLTFNQADNLLHNCWAGDDGHNSGFGLPLLVLDMHEHAYMADYGTHIQGYIEAFLGNINWQKVMLSFNGITSDKISSNCSDL